MIRETIQKELTKRGWSVLKLSNETGIRYASLTEYLKGNKELSSKNLEIICKTLNLKLMKPTNKFEQKVFWLNFDNEIEETTYGDMVREFADETTTPNGVAPRMHVRENEEEGTYELWSWGVQGNNPSFVRSFDTEEEANYALYETFEADMNEQDQYVVFYNDDKEALKKELKELEEERNDN